MLHAGAEASDGVEERDDDRDEGDVEEGFHLIIIVFSA